MGVKSTNKYSGPNNSTTPWVDGHLDQWYNSAFDAGGRAAVQPAGPPASENPDGHTATGGIISDYGTPPGAVYRSHTFLSSGTFTVSGLSPTYPAHVGYLVVGGGGGGGYEGDGSGGGGAGAVRTSISTQGGPGNSAASSFSVTTQAYPVLVGAGGAAGNPSNPTPKVGIPGGTSQFGPPTAGDVVIALGGGGAGGNGTAGASSPGATGGSGGGAGGYGFPAPGAWEGGEGGTYGYDGGPNYPTPNPGASASGSRATGGGGGAGGVGAPGTAASPNAIGGDGGIGVQVLATGSPGASGIAGAPGPGGTYQWFGGGGGGGIGQNSETSGTGGGPGGPYAGGGDGGGSGPGQGPDGTSGLTGTGGGGGGAGAVPYAGNGGSGTVVVRYQIGTVAPQQSATGGQVSLYNSKWIHTFTSSGEFICPAEVSSCEIVVVGGGGGGGYYGGAGGGAGGYRHRTGVTLPAQTYTVIVGAGGRGGLTQPQAGTFTQGNESSIMQNYGTPTASGISIGSGGGGGGSYAGNGNPGGSGGGLGWNAPSSGATIASPDGISPTVQGFPAGPTYGPGGGASSNPHSASGGGGASAAGTNGNSTQPSTQVVGGNGGAGQQLPTTFWNPISIPGAYGGMLGGPSPSYDPVGPQDFTPDLRGNLGAPGPVTHPSPGSVDNSGLYWVCGGGGGGSFRNHGVGGRGGHPGATAVGDYPFSGGGSSYGETPGVGAVGQHGLAGTGGGGGGGFYGDGGPNDVFTCRGGSGGSGLILIAYPST